MDTKGKFKEWYPATKELDDLFKNFEKEALSRVEFNAVRGFYITARDKIIKEELKTFQSYSDSLGSDVRMVVAIGFGVAFFTFIIFRFVFGC